MTINEATVLNVMTGSFSLQLKWSTTACKTNKVWDLVDIPAGRNQLNTVGSSKSYAMRQEESSNTKHESYKPPVYHGLGLFPRKHERASHCLRKGSIDTVGVI